MGGGTGFRVGTAVLAGEIVCGEPLAPFHGDVFREG